MYKHTEGTMPKSWKPEQQVDGRWYDNAQRFATEDEAKASALARFQVWTMPTDWRAVPSEDPVNYRWTGRDERIEDATEVRG